MNGVNKIIMKKRDQWSSNFGFLMAAAGSAVGLGNLWKFPYVVGMNGGGIFIIAYVILFSITWRSYTYVRNGYRKKHTFESYRRMQ